LAQGHIKKYKHLKMSILKKTFEIDYAVALTPPNCSVKKDEKTQTITSECVSKDKS
jgi:hypothetical protein